MPIYYFIKTYWKPLTMLLMLVLYVAAVKWYGISQYNKGVTYAVAKTQAQYAVIIAKKDAQAKAASKNYQELKSAREAEQGVQYVEVEKIVLKPIYFNDCIDDDGVSAINNAINRK